MDEKYQDQTENTQEASREENARHNTDGEAPVRRVTPDGEAPVRRRVTPDGEVPVRRRVTPDGEAPVRRRVTPDGEAPVRRVTPDGEVPVRRRVTPDGEAPVRRVTPDGEVPVRRRATPDGATPVRRAAQDGEAPVRRRATPDGATPVRRAAQDGEAPVRRRAAQDGEAPVRRRTSQEGANAARVRASEDIDFSRDGGLEKRSTVSRRPKETEAASVQRDMKRDRIRKAEAAGKEKSSGQKKTKNRMRGAAIAGVILAIVAIIGLAVWFQINEGGLDFGKKPSQTLPSQTVAETIEQEITTETETKEMTEAETELETELVEETTLAPEESANWLYATAVVNVRSIPDITGEILGKLQVGEAVEAAGASENGWTPIVYNGTIAYVSSEYLSAELPQTAANAVQTQAPHEGAWDLVSLDTKGVNFGYADNQRLENMVPGDWPWYEAQWGQFNVDWIQDTNSNTIYLTMDEGYGNDQTAVILDTLRDKNVKIVFFITQNFLNDRPELVQRMINEGHIVGNHSCTHPNMSSLSLEDATAQIMNLHNAVKEQFGYEMKLFRFPEGIYSNQLLGLVDNLGYKTVFWSFAYDDYSSNHLGVEEARTKIWNYMHPGAIYLLHANSDVNMTLLPSFIDEARSRGYEFGVYPLTAN